MTDTARTDLEMTASAALLVVLETFERLVDTVETELDADSREGDEPTGEAWGQSCDRILACVREGKRAMDRPEVLAALGQ